MFKIKNIVSLFIILLLIGCGAGTRNIESLMTDQTEMRVYEVFGMDCPGCHGGLENIVNKIDGVIASQANWEQQTLKIIVSKGMEISDEKIFEAVKKANFTPGNRLE